MPTVVQQGALAPDVLLVDGEHMAYRAFYVNAELEYNGVASGVVYGVLNMVRTQLERLSPKRMVFAWGAEASGSRRRALLPTYKANRPPHPNFRTQLKDIQLFLSYMQWEQYFNSDGWEADDVLATLTNFYSYAGQSVVILSGDHDFFQLVSDRVSCLVPGTRQKPDLFVTPSVVRERYAGVSPQLLPDVYALAGETSDNIIGLYLVGVTKASKMVVDNGELETWITTPEKAFVPKRVKALLATEQERLLLNKRLISLLDSQVELSEIQTLPSSTLAQELLNYYGIQKFAAHDFIPPDVR